MDIIGVLGLALSAIGLISNASSEQDRKREEFLKRFNAEIKKEDQIRKLSFVFGIIISIGLFLLLHYVWWPSLFINNPWWMWILIVAGFLFSSFVFFAFLFFILDWIFVSIPTGYDK